ncbi:hypothetical protein ACIBF1_44105 [Spirillospora sp. NPDC050679]
MSGPSRRNDESERFWRIRTGLEFFKAGVWVIFQWFRPGGPFGPF